MWNFFKEDRGKLQEEYPVFLSKVADLTAVDVLSWWRANGKAIPTWCTWARKILAISPSSAAVERVFSLLNAYVGSRQDALLDESLETMLILMYNEKEEKKE